MKQSLSLRRILTLVFTSVLLSAMITLGMYSVLSPQIFAQAKVDELQPRAQFLAEQAALYFSSGNESSQSVQYMHFFSLDSRQWGATVYLLDKDRNVIANSDESVTHSAYSMSIENFESIVQRVLEGQPVSYVSYSVRQPDLDKKALNVVIIGIPVEVGEQVVGAVIMLKPLDEIVSAMSTLSSALWFSMLVVLMAVMPLVYWLSRRIVQPVQEMRGVALRMAGGDFSLRANEAERGEVGDLARALNHLSMELGSTISDLTWERNQAVAIVNVLNEGVLVVDGGLHPTQINPALRAMMTAAGNGAAAPLPEEVWEDFRCALREGRCTERRFSFGDLKLHLVVTPIADMQRGGGRAIGVFHDETQAHRLEQTRREYVANVSHELRTPLTALRALIEPLRDGLIRTEEKRAETYGIILRETMRLSRLVDDMLELSRLQSGKLALEKIRFKVEPLLHDTASVYAAKATDTGHVLVLDLGAAPLPTVLGNPDRVEQVLVALLNNAFIYTPSGSRIVLRAEAMEAFLLVTVEDNGPGIHPGDIDHVFDRFYKADKAHGGGGTGLGLAIAQELMQRLGETITVENRETGGARFSFTLHYQ